MRRSAIGRVLTVGATTVLFLAVMAPLAAAGDICVSIHGEVRVQRGSSGCNSSGSGRAIAVNGSDANGDGENMSAIAINGSDATANGSSDNHALAVNNSHANAWDAPSPGGSTSKAINDSYSDVSNGSFGFAVNGSEAFSDNGGAACAHNGEIVDDTGGAGDGCP